VLTLVLVNSKPDRKATLLTDPHLISYDWKKCIVSCPNCTTTRSVSTNDYYKKRLNGLVLCRTCSKPNKRKDAINNDPQVIEQPTIFTKGKTVWLTVECANCHTTTKINISAYLKIKQRDGAWTCLNCRRPALTAASRANKLYADENYRAQFAELHRNDDYRSRVHNQQVYDKIAESTKAAWNDPEKRQRHLAHRQTPQFREATSKVLKDYRLANAAQDRATRQDNFITKAHLLYDGQYDYSQIDYERTNTPIIIKCGNCGTLFHQLPMVHLRHSCRCPQCNISAGQQEIYDFLKDRFKCIINNKECTPPYEIDIFLPDHHLGIEYHGLYWHSYDRPETTNERSRHQRKYLAATVAGITLLQFTDYEWREQNAIVKSMIEHRLGTSQRIGARHLVVRTVNHHDALLFFNHNHLSGHRNAETTLGLYDSDRLMMAMSCSHITGTNNLEIIRMASQIGYNISGGASKLLTHIIRRERPRSVFTFADLRYSSGAGYKKLGFTELYKTKPGYLYFKDGLIKSRYQCQKHKLDKLLESFDPQLSEARNMFKNGYRRFWDAGNLRLSMVIEG
jgi:hypothetical protein